MKPGASIIGTSSVNAKTPSPHLLAYATTKGAIANFTAGLAQLVAEKGVRVNCVAPGPVWTPLIPSTMPPEAGRDLRPEHAAWPAGTTGGTGRAPTSCSPPTSPATSPAPISRSPAAGPHCRKATPCPREVESTAESRRRRSVGEAWRHQEERSARRIPLHGRFDVGEGTARHGVNQAEEQTGARREVLTQAVLLLPPIPRR